MRLHLLDWLALIPHRCGLPPAHVRSHHLGPIVCLLLSSPSGASSLVVPDHVPTVQAALDAGVDTVLIRTGNYAETPVLSRPVRLIGVPGASVLPRPILSALWVAPLPNPVHPTVIEATNIEVEGPAYILNDDEISHILFNNCRMMAGISDISTYPTTNLLSLRNCEIRGDTHLKADGACVLDSCTVEGQLTVGPQDLRLTVIGSSFSGSGTGIAIGTFAGGASAIFSARIVGTTVAGYGGGIAISAIDTVSVFDSRVSECPWGGVWIRGGVARVVNCTLARCGVAGLEVEAGRLELTRNVVSRCGAAGIRAIVGSGSITGNVVWGGTGIGLHLVDQIGGELAIRNNTSCDNAGAGFLSECQIGEGARYLIENNIGYGNGSYGVQVTAAPPTVLRCNDWYGNALGDVDGVPVSSEDFTLDPLFCDPLSGDFALSATSPLASMQGCGLVGALGVGCGVTSTRVVRFSAERSRTGVRVLWELAGGSTADHVWLERSETGDQGPWSRPALQRIREGNVEVGLDDTAVADRDYWYRLMARESGATTVIGQPIRVDAQHGTAFRLVAVGPSPAGGPVRIEFELPNQAAVGVDVFDVQGRLVASPVHGAWPTGRHVVEWAGSNGNGRLASGVYLVRYRYPGGEVQRRVVRAP